VAWTAERIRRLGATTDRATAAAILGISRSAAYKLARRDAFPVPLLRIGTRYRVPTAPLLAALHLPSGDRRPRSEPAIPNRPGCGSSPALT
jgi:Helix-turn-helix domain